MTDDEPRIAETARLWRLNSIAALKMMVRNESEALDPEHLEKIRAEVAELAALLAQEKVVQDRHARILKHRENRLSRNP